MPCSFSSSRPPGPPRRSLRCARPTASTTMRSAPRASRAVAGRAPARRSATTLAARSAPGSARAGGRAAGTPASRAMSVHESSSVVVHAIDAAAADLAAPPPPPRHRRNARARGRSATGSQRAVAEDVRGREVAAARRLEHLEHRDGCSRGSRSRRRVRSRGSIDVAPKRPGSSSASAERPGRVLADHDEQPAAALDEPLQHAAAGGRRKHRVVQDHDGLRCRTLAGVTRARRHNFDLKRRRRPDRQRFRQVTGSRLDRCRCRRPGSTPAGSARGRNRTRCRPAAGRSRRAPCRGRSRPTA